MDSLPFFYSEEFLNYDMGPQHPLRPERLKMTHDLLAAYSLFDSTLRVEAPSPISPAELAKTHEPRFIAAVELLSSGNTSGVQADRFGFGSGDNPIFPGMYEASLTYTGASRDAAQAVLDGAPVAFNISGGLHHAHFARAAGFCVFNDPAAAIHLLRTRYDRVAYVDIDVHHGDGVQELFYEDPTVLTISTHESGRTLFPGTGDTREIGEGAGEGFSVNLPHAPGATDEIWLGAWRAAGLPILKAFKPGAILLQMGADPHSLDPLAHLELTAQGWLEAVKDVRELGVPIVAVGGGGYNLSTVPRMWTLAISTLAGIDLPDSVPAQYWYRDAMPFLRDPHPPLVNPQTVRIAARFADERVAEIKQSLFGRFGL